MLSIHSPHEKDTVAGAAKTIEAVGWACLQGVVEKQGKRAIDGVPYGTFLVRAVFQQSENVFLHNWVGCGGPVLKGRVHDFSQEGAEIGVQSQ